MRVDQVVRALEAHFLGDENFLSGLGPASVFAEAAMGANGADDAVGGGCNGFGLLDDECEGAARFCGALVEQAESVGVAIHDSAVAQLEFMGDGGGPLPVKEGFVDGGAFPVVADRAACFMVAKACVAVVAPLELGAGP